MACFGPVAQQQHGNDASAEADFRFAKACVLGRDRDVAREGQFERARNAVAMDGGDRRFRGMPELHDEIELQLHLLFPVLDALHPSFGRRLEVKTG